MLETTIESCVVDYAEKRGWWCRKASWQGRRGAPDRLFIKLGRVVFVEFKRPGKTPDRLQNKEIDRLRRAGVEVHVIDNIEKGNALFADVLA